VIKANRKKKSTRNPLLIMPLPPESGQWSSEYRRRWRSLLAAQREIAQAQLEVLDMQERLLEEMENRAKLDTEKAENLG
jgi:hypothetical protein